MDDWTAELAAAREAARRAGTMLRQSIGGANEVYFKGEVNLVTDCDRRAQEMIFEDLHGRFPGHDFLGEEDLNRDTGSDFQWIVDPLDGTTNFAHRFPIYSVSIALRHRDEIVVGVVFDPSRAEEFRAVRGGGAFLNSSPLSVSAVADLGRSLLATGFPYDIRQSRANIGHFLNFIVRAQAVRRCGSAALDLCYVAAGRFDGFWEMKLNPWDAAAASLVIREAGGLTTDFSGRPIRTTHPEVLASNGLIHASMLDVLALKGDDPHDRT